MYSVCYGIAFNFAKCGPRCSPHFLNRTHPPVYTSDSNFDRRRLAVLNATPEDALRLWRLYASTWSSLIICGRLRIRRYFIGTKSVILRTTWGVLIRYKVCLYALLRLPRALISLITSCARFFSMCSVIWNSKPCARCLYSNSQASSGSTPLNRSEVFTSITSLSTMKEIILLLACSTFKSRKLLLVWSEILAKSSQKIH